MICALTITGSAQKSAKGGTPPDSVMASFKNSIVTKNPTLFLSFISPTKGLTVMNTIDQGTAGNVDKPMLASSTKYSALAADFKKRGDIYAEYFKKSEYDPSFYDYMLSYKGDWKLGADNKFMPIDAETKKPEKAFYVKWEQAGSKWYVTEIGRPLS
jgi:hypothetical protein